MTDAATILSAAAPWLHGAAVLYGLAVLGAAVATVLTTHERPR